MIEIPRELVRHFRAVLRKSLLDQGPRDAWPLVLFRTGKEGLVLQACQGDRAVRYHREGPRPPDALAFRAAALAAFEGRGQDSVSMEPLAFGKGRASWAESGVPRSLDLETVVPESVPAFPAPPRQFTPMPANFAAALDEAARTTPKDAVRFALTRVQLRGKRGEVVATDGKQLLIQGGFPFPWEDSVLVPRLSVFGGRELAGVEEVAVGRTKTHVGLKAGPWTFLLAVDTTGRFPEVDQVIPRKDPNASRLILDPEDAAFLVSCLPRLPGGEEQHAPVTLDLARTVTVRARGDGAGPLTEVILSKSSTTGQPVRLVLDRHFLHRALKLGFSEIEIQGPDRPVACRDRQRCYVWMPLDHSGALGPDPNARQVLSTSPAPEAVSPTTQPQNQRRDVPMAHASNNGKPRPDEVATSQPAESPAPAPERGGTLAGLVAEAEAIRGLLHDADTRLARLLAALKHQRKQSRAVLAAMASLRQLQHLTP